jgi:hypothetical protein
MQADSARNNLVIYIHICLGYQEYAHSAQTLRSSAEELLKKTVMQCTEPARNSYIYMLYFLNYQPPGRLLLCWIS